MKLTKKTFLGTALGLALFCPAAMAQTTTDLPPVVSPVQSPARPLGLPVHGPVYLAASDARSADFYTNAMPDFLAIIEDHLSETVVFDGRDGFKLDPSRLFLRTESDKPIRIYFLFEGAGYHNTVGFCWTEAGDPVKSGKTVLFPDASICHPVSTTARTEWEPLKPGDFVEIGVGNNGYQLDFFLISDAVRGGEQWLWADKNENPDGLQHMVAFMLQDSPYILLGFEDIIGGGDLDYNDSLFVVDIGEINAENLFDDDGTLPH